MQSTCSKLFKFKMLANIALPFRLAIINYQVMVESVHYIDTKPIDIFNKSQFETFAPSFILCCFGIKLLCKVIITSISVAARSVRPRMQAVAARCNRRKDQVVIADRYRSDLKRPIFRSASPFLKPSFHEIHRCIPMHRNSSSGQHGIGCCALVLCALASLLALLLTFVSASDRFRTKVLAAPQSFDRRDRYGGNALKQNDTIACISYLFTCISTTITNTTTTNRTVGISLLNNNLSFPCIFV